MNPWLALAIFLLSVGDDILVVYYLRRVITGRRVAASLLSGALTILISLEVFVYVSNWQYILPNALGSVIGTWLALRIEEKLPKVKPRTSQGRFKPAPAPSEFQRGEKRL